MMISKKNLIFSILFVVLLIIVAGVTYFFREYKNVTFTITYPAPATILDQTNSSGEGREVATIKNGESIWLEKQDYHAKFSDDKLSSSTIPITIGNDTTTITLDPNLSSDTLNRLLEEQREALEEKIKSSVQSDADSPYSLEKGQLFHRGEWYAAPLHIYQASSADPLVGNPDSVDTYYIVLKKEGDDWQLAAGPSLIITRPDNPNIPGYVIEAINPTRSF